MYFGNQDYGEVTSHTISVGRDISETDCNSRARVCVIGETIRKYFFGAMSPLGQKIRIGGKSFEIIGVYEGKYDGKLNTEDQMIVMPYTLQSSMMSMSGISDKQYVIKAANKEDISELTNTLLPEFMQSRCENNGGYFSAYSNSEWQEQSESSTNMLAFLGGGIASISLLVGGIGIMNIMLVTDTERTREIGIRKALGAKERSILALFVAEAATTSALGGVIGILLGYMVSAAASPLVAVVMGDPSMTISPSPSSVMIAFGVSVGIGVLFGYLPAKRAARLNPIEALRYD